MATPQLCDALIALIQEFTNVRIFTSITKQMKYFRYYRLRWSFTHFYSHKYCTSSEFRARVALTIHDLYSQLDITLPLSDSFYNFPVLPGVHKVDLSRNSAISNVNLPLFANAHTLIMTNHSRYTTISDLTPLRNVRILDLTDCFYIMDVSVLQNVEEINLSYCYRLTDVSPLRNARKVILKCCYGITDVSSLQNVDTLDLHTCINVTDVSKLTNVRKLCLRNCSSVTSVVGLQNVQELDIRECNVEGVETLPNLRTLYKDNLIVKFPRRDTKT